MQGLNLPHCSLGQPLSAREIIEVSNMMQETDVPVIILYGYIERPHIQKFIKDRTQVNLDAFIRGSSRVNDYQGISISGGSGTGKTFEAINIFKDLDRIHDFEVIHIFVRIFSDIPIAHFVT